MTLQQFAQNPSGPVRAWFRVQPPPAPKALGTCLRAVAYALAAVTSLLILQRLDAALSSIISIRSVGGNVVADESVPGGLDVAWIFFNVSGLAAVIAFARLWPSGVAGPVLVLVRAFIGIWLLSAVLGFDLLMHQTGHPSVWAHEDALQPLRNALRIAGVLVVVLIGVGLRASLPSPGALWRHASVIRVQLISLAMLIALIYAFPMTSGQAIDVLRAWTDASLVRVICAIAAAIFLGAVIRDSCTSFLAQATDAAAQKRDGKLPSPASVPGRNQLKPRLIQALIALAIGVVADHATHLTLILVAAGAFAVWRVTWPAGPLPFADGTPEMTARLRTLARFLACVPLLTLFVGLVVASTDSFLIRGGAEQGDYELFAIMLVAGLLSGVLLMRAGVREPSTPPWTSRRGKWAMPALAAAVVAGCGLPAPFGVISAVLFLLLACYLGLASETSDPIRLEVRCGVGACAGAVALVYLQPVRGTDAIGTFGLVMLAMVGLLLAVHGLAHLAASRAPLGALASVLPERVPVVTLLALWVVAAFAWGPDELHQVRTIDPASASQATLPATTFAGEVDAWLDARAKDPKTPSNVNMVLVAAAGGGEKVAFWTDLVLDCALSDPARDSDDHCDGSSGRQADGRIFLTSSVSGGSVGIYRYLRSLKAVRDGDPWPGNTDAAWTSGKDSSVPREVLSPITGWGLFHDLPFFLSGIPTNPEDCTGAWSCRLNADRAAVQEEAVAEPFHSGGESDWFTPSAQPVATLPSPADGAGDAPLAVFNGAIDGGNGRVLIAPVRLAPPYDPTETCLPLSTGSAAPVPRVPGAIDAHDLIGSRQIPLVTASLLTARFPVVAPAGRLGVVRSTDATTAKGAAANSIHCTAQTPLPDIRVRDGGYIENTGLLTIVDLLPALRSEIGAWMRRKHTGRRFSVHIAVVSIDDDATTLEPQPGAFSQQSAGPTGISARASSDYLTTLARDKLTSGALEDVTYLRVSPPPTVGAHAATGWELSSTTRKRHLVAAVTLPVGTGGERAARRALLRFRCLLADETYDPAIPLGQAVQCLPH